MGIYMLYLYLDAPDIYTIHPLSFTIFTFFNIQEIQVYIYIYIYHMHAIYANILPYIDDRCTKGMYAPYMYKYIYTYLYIHTYTTMFQCIVEA